MILKTRNGAVIDQPDSQERILSILYGTLPGRLLLKPLTAPIVSRAAGAFLSSRLSRPLIAPFIRRNGIDMSQFVPQDYPSYNAFFSRQIRPEVRPIDPEPAHLISPCDSRLTVLPISPDCRLRLKQTEYTLQSLLRSDELAQAYQGGQALIFRLCVEDYHRYCFIADGQPEASRRIPGILHTVNPIANDHYPIYKENSREYTILHTDAFGDVLIMEVGALLVGRICNHPIRGPVSRGQEKGYFQFGGSTVVLLLKEGAARIDPDILENSQANIETRVHYGEKIGIALPK